VRDLKRQLGMIGECLPSSPYKDTVVKVASAAIDEIERLTRLNANLMDGEMPVCGDCDGTGWLYNRIDGRYACTCMTEAEPYQLLESDRDKLQVEVDAARKQGARYYMTEKFIPIERHRVEILDGRKNAFREAAQIAYSIGKKHDAAGQEFDAAGAYEVMTAIESV